MDDGHRGGRVGDDDDVHQDKELLPSPQLEKEEREEVTHSESYFDVNQSVSMDDSMTTAATICSSTSATTSSTIENRAGSNAVSDGTSYDNIMGWSPAPHVYNGLILPLPELETEETVSRSKSLV